MHWLFGHNFGEVIGKRETEKCPNEMTVIKPKGSFSIQWRVVGWGYLWTSCKPYIRWVALKTRGGCLSRCPNSSVFSVVSAQPIHPAKCLSIMRLVHIVTCGVCKGEKDVCDKKQKMCVMKSAWNRSRERLRLDPWGCPPYSYTDSWRGIHLKDPFLSIRYSRSFAFVNWSCPRQ